jgi:nitrogen fixation/metabolism regulation signal transduction histidine kinase
MRTIRARILGVIMLAALLPAIPLSLAFRDMVDRSWSSDFLAVIEQGVESGLTELQASFRAEKQHLNDDVDRLWRPMLAMEWNSPVVLGIDGRPDSSLTAPESVISAHPVDGELPMKVEDWLVTARTLPGSRSVLFARQMPADLITRADEIASANSLLHGIRIEKEDGKIIRSYVKPFLVAYSLILLVALGIAILFAERLTRPLVALSTTAHLVGDGDLDARVAHRSGGEIGDLITAFNSMVAGLSTQRRELARLEKMAAWRGMARVLAHEIKNPLTPILLAVQETRRSDPGDHASHSKMLADCESIVTEEVEGLRNLVRSFSDFARMPKPEPMVHDLGDILDDLGRLYGQLLVVKHPDGPLPRFLDHSQVRRALVNLIDNGLTAVQRAGSKTPVSISLHTDNNCDVIQVVDQGDGISADNLDRVFEPDFTTGSGMGLGLPIVLGIAEGHGGSLTITSVPGEGTTLTMTLPRLEEATP